MTLDELPGALEEMKRKLVETVIEECIPAAAPAFMGEYKTRIFTKGLDSDGNKIGTYSTTPGYFSAKQAVRKGAIKPVGKHGEKKFKEGPKKGQPHKSMYLKRGYAEFREIQGRQSEFQDWRLSGSLFSAVQVYRIDNRTVIAIADTKESLKRKALEKQSKRIVFLAAETDIKVFSDALYEEVKIAKERIFG